MTKEARERAAAAGELPHEFLLRVMRGECVLSREAPSMAQRLDAAKAAAPYYAPRIASVIHDGGIEVKEREYSALEVARRIAFQAELICREIESKRPDLAPVDRRSVAHRLMDQIIGEARKKSPESKAA